MIVNAERLPLDFFWVGVSDDQVSAQSGKTQGVEGPGSIWVVSQVVPCITRKMVDLDVIAHLKQLV